MMKFAALVFCVLVSFNVAVNGDTIVLRSAGKDVDLKVIGVTGEYVNAVLPKKYLKSLNMQFLNTANYPDVISFDIANEAVECKIREITEDAIHVLIPTSKISSLQMFFQSDGKQAVAPSAGIDLKQKITDSPEKKEKPPHFTTEAERKPEVQKNGGDNALFEEIRTDIIENKEAGKHYRLKTKKAKKKDLLKEDGKLVTDAENAPEGIPESVEEETPLAVSGESSESDQDLLKESYDKEDIGEDVEADDADDAGKSEPIVQNRKLGGVEGKILQGGNPLSGCQVKLQMLEKAGLLAKGYRPIEGAVEIETATDNDGVYHFVNVSPGLYKLYWKPPSETTWVRRFKMEPDVIVESGKTTKPKKIETTKRTLN